MKGIPEIMVCRILVFTWYCGPLYMYIDVCICIYIYMACKEVVKCCTLNMQGFCKVSFANSPSVLALHSKTSFMLSVRLQVPEHLNRRQMRKTRSTVPDTKVGSS